MTAALLPSSGPEPALSSFPAGIGAGGSPGAPVSAVPVAPGAHVCKVRVCCGCGAEGPDVAALNLDDEDHGFCSTACLVAYVRRRFVEGR